jgi:hypothetical protein
MVLHHARGHCAMWSVLQLHLLLLNTVWLFTSCSAAALRSPYGSSCGLHETSTARVLLSDQRSMHYGFYFVQNAHSNFLSL